MMKKTISLFLAAVIMSCAFLTVPMTVYAEDDIGISPYFTNFYNGTINFSVSTSGYAEVKATVYTNSYTTGGTIYTYIQRKDGNTWSTINNGQENNQWADTFGSSGRTVTHYMYLPSKWISYRAVAVFYVRGTGGVADSVVKYSVTRTF